MAKVNLSSPIYHDEAAARAHLEALLWPQGPVCPRCGVMGDRITKLEGKSTRPGVYKCKDCRKPFSVTVNTVMERSKVPLTKWLLAAQLMASSKKGRANTRNIGCVTLAILGTAGGMMPTDCGPPSESLTRGPKRLWSLWEMLELIAKDFVTAVRVIQHTESFISTKGKNLDRGEQLKETSIQVIRNGMVGLRPSLISLGANISLMALADFEEELSDNPTWGVVEDCADDLRRTLVRELTRTKLLSLNDREQLLFLPPEPPFGAKFEAGFRSNGNFELSEACKCMALERPTAAVFHLMRIMELGLRATSRSLGIPDPTKPNEKTWGRILTAMWGGIEARWPTGAARMEGDGRLFEHLYATLDAVKTPLRDSTMHVESTYTESEARHIFELVRGFMVKLSDRMDENGEPRCP